MRSESGKGNTMSEKNLNQATATSPSMDLTSMSTGDAPKNNPELNDEELQKLSGGPCPLCRFERNTVQTQD